MRRPTAEPERVEGRAQPAVGVGKPIRINLLGAKKHFAPRRLAQPGDERVRGSEGAQIAHQRENVRIAHDCPVGVHDRQGEAGALQQAADRAHVGEWRHPRRGAARDFALRDRQRLPEFGQRVAAGQRGDQQPVRPQRLPQLDQRARQVVDEMQRVQRDHEVEALGLEPWVFGVGVWALVRRRRDPKGRARAGPGHQNICGVRRRGPDIGGVEKFPLDQAQAVFEFLAGAHKKEIGAGHRAARRALEAAGDEVAIEKAGRGAHNGLMARTRASRQRANWTTFSSVETVFEQADAPPPRKRLGPWLRASLRAIASVVYPPTCLSCRAATAEPDGLCPRCWRAITFIERPYCERLGTPFGTEIGETRLSREAVDDPPVFARARAVVVFADGPARRLVHRLKYSDRAELARPMGRWMARSGAELLAAADVVTPMPLHRLRLWSRRFNQAAALAREVARASGKPYAPLLLERVVATRSQVGLTRRQRAENVQKAFRAATGAPVRGRRIVLVDDVLTSGASANAASRALLRAGAAQVDVLVFARVVGGGRSSI
jgi:ComF family protein